MANARDLGKNTICSALLRCALLRLELHPHLVFLQRSLPV